MTRAPRSTQKAAQQADQAADQLLEWLRQQRSGIFDESLYAAKYDALLVVNQMMVGELAPDSAASIIDDEDLLRLGLRGRSRVEVEAFCLRDVGVLLRDVSSHRRSTDAIEVVEAFAQASVSRRPASFGSAAAGVEEMTSPLREHSGADEG